MLYEHGCLRFALDESVSNASRPLSFLSSHIVKLNLKHTNKFKRTIKDVQETQSIHNHTAHVCSVSSCAKPMEEYGSEDRSIWP